MARKRTVKSPKSKANKKNSNINKSKSKSGNKDKYTPIGYDSTSYQALMQKDLAELRTIGKIYHVKTGGIEKPTLAKRVSVALKENQNKAKVKASKNAIEPSVTNTQDGAITTVAFDEKGKYKVIITDLDEKPLSKATIEGGDGVYQVDQELMFGTKKEGLQVQVIEDPHVQYERIEKEKKKEKWIVEATKNKGSMRKYMRDRFGAEAFTKKDTIRVAYLNKVIKDPNVTETTKKRAVLAKTLKKMNKKK